MLLQILAGIHNITTLLFGIFVSSFFLGIKQDKKNVLKLLAFFSLAGIIYIINFVIFGTTFSSQIYPLIIHLPLLLLLVFYYKYRPLSALVSILTAYLCCQCSNWAGLLVFGLTNQVWCYYSARIAVTILTFFLLIRYVCPTTEHIFAKNNREICIIGFLPLIYYVFDYITTKFSVLHYSGNKSVVEFLGFTLCMAYLCFLLIYLREYEQKQEIKQYNELMDIKLLSMQKEIEQMQSSQKTISILRHDMRHHLNTLLTLIQNNRGAEACGYIKEISEIYDDTIITRYCKNEMLNSVISIYHDRFLEKGFPFDTDITISHTPSCSDIALCTILSNGLENAIHAVESLEPKKGRITLSISEKDQHILLLIKNPTSRIPIFVNGIPVSNQSGHGIGVQSMLYYTEKLHGQCHFSVKENIFCVKIII